MNVSSSSVYESPQPINYQTTRQHHADSSTSGAVRTVHRTHLSNPQPRLDTAGRRVPRDIIPRPALTSIQPAAHTPQRPAGAAHLRSLPSPTGSAFSLINNAFSAYAERWQAEFANLRAICTRAILKEKQDSQKWRTHCVSFKQERDVARERVRVLIGEREANLASAEPRYQGNPIEERNSDPDANKSAPETAGSVPSRESTPSSTAVASDPEDDLARFVLAYPPATVACPDIPLPLASPPMRSRSAGPVLPSMTFKRDLTAFDVTVTENPHGDRWIRSERAIKRRKHIDLEPYSNPPAACGTTGRELDASQIAEKGRPKVGPGSPSRSPPPVSPSLRGEIELTHVDLMYVPTNGKLVCRVCMLHSTKNPTANLLPTSFATDSSWDTLRDHCMKEHPSECADVARLHPAEVYELRRRLMMRRSP